MKSFFVALLLCLCLFLYPVQAGFFTVGNQWFDENESKTLSLWINDVEYEEHVIGMKLVIDEDCMMYSISGVFSTTSTIPVRILFCLYLYSPDGSMIMDTTPFIFISGSTPSVYTSSFSLPVLLEPSESSIDEYVLAVYGEKSRPEGGHLPLLIYGVSSTNGGYIDITGNNFPNFPDDVIFSFNSGFTPSLFCNVNKTLDIAFYNNTVNVSGGFDYSYNPYDGFKIWMNFSGLTTPINLYKDIVNASGSHWYFLNSSGYHVYAVFTGNTTPIFLYKNFINSTGTLEYLLNISGYHVYANVTGNESGNVSGYTEEELTTYVSTFSILILCCGLVIFRRKRRKYVDF